MDRYPQWATAAAVIVAGLLIAASILFVGHWGIAASNDGVYRLNRWTGKVDECGPDVSRIRDDREMGQSCPMKILPNQ